MPPAGRRQEQRAAGPAERVVKAAFTRMHGCGIRQEGLEAGQSGAAHCVSAGEPSAADTAQGRRRESIVSQTNICIVAADE